MQNTKYVDRAGIFTCEVEEPEDWIGESGTKQTPFLRLVLKVVTPGDQAGKILVHRGWLSENAIDRTIANLAEVFDWDGDIVSLANRRTSLAGKQCDVVADEEIYDGKRRVKVSWVNRVGATGGNSTDAMDSNKLNDLLKRVGGRAKAVAKATLAGEKKPKAELPALSTKTKDDDGDEVPFN